MNDEALKNWLSAATHILDVLAESNGLESDRASLIKHFNEATDNSWTTEYVENTRSTVRSKDSLTNRRRQEM